jgi:hypothetical protein
MAQTNIRHASAFKPISVAELHAIDKDNWDRVQTFNAATTQPEEKLYELGRKAKMATDKGTFQTTLSMTQFEYGTIDSFLQLSGLSALPSGGFELSDFDDPRTDFISPGKDQYGGTVEQTLWVEDMALTSFGLTINADDQIERSFEFTGEYAKIAREGNKYVIFTTDDAPSGTSGSYTIDVSDPAPVVDPNNAGEYILKLYRIRSGVATELDLTTDYTYSNSTKLITILSALASDHYRIWYTAASYGSAGDPEALNNSDRYYLPSENVTITIDDGVHTAVELTKITSFSLTASLNRTDQAVVGSTTKLKDTESYDVSISIDQLVKNYPIEEALMGQAGQSWGIIDYTAFDEVDVVVKIYTTSAKSVFLIGYKVPSATFADGTPANYNANAFGSNPNTLNSDELIISTTEGDLA